METYRRIKEVVKGEETRDGAGVRLVRLFNCRTAERFDPFLMMDAFDNSRSEDYIKGFPWHPHRGIETITYLIEGKVDHGDSLGNKGRILDGDCQWMTAGSGIIHQEMPQPPGRMLGVQIWLNLPADGKMAPPAYGDIRSDAIPIIREEGCEIRLIAGSYRGVQGAFEGRYIKPLFMDISLAPHTLWELPTDADHTLYTYIFHGEGRFDADCPPMGEKNVLLFSSGSRIRVKAEDSALRFILLSAPPTA
ncbi:pirin family protein [Desulfobotulus sp. H1]|uniref:Pirin family protein n=1 Tax=Desulfobotulus pelophilus TaxID=2823377 RepID=A0ABT3NCM7_9BACT|nr:pirin family protein [Desulfobotulus pelophilus]MCW7755225.1 pirin family protein [Desulfobotulus pelophilus]